MQPQANRNAEYSGGSRTRGRTCSFADMETARSPSDNSSRAKQMRPPCSLALFSGINPPRLRGARRGPNFDRSEDALMRKGRFAIRVREKPLIGCAQLATRIYLRSLLN